MTGDLTFVILGACEGTLSCSTCHIIFKPEEMAALNLDEPSDEELDMLDLAYGLEKTWVCGNITVFCSFCLFNWSCLLGQHK